jgi:hypothetical protein
MASQSTGESGKTEKKPETAFESSNEEDNERLRSLCEEAGFKAAPKHFSISIIDEDEGVPPDVSTASTIELNTWMLQCTLGYVQASGATSLGRHLYEQFKEDFEGWKATEFSRIHRPMLFRLQKVLYGRGVYTTPTRPAEKLAALVATERIPDWDQEALDAAKLENPEALWWKVYEGLKAASAAAARSSQEGNQGGSQGGDQGASAAGEGGQEGSQHHNSGGSQQREPGSAQDDQNLQEDSKKHLQ